MPSIRSALLLCPAVLALAAGTAGAADAPIDRNLDFGFTTTKAGAATGMRFAVQQRPTPKGEQAPPVRSTQLIFPTGTRFDLGAVTPCTAAPAAVQAGGAATCPAASRLGGGTVGLFLGATSPSEPAAVFATPTGILLVISSDTGAVLRAVPGTLSGRRLKIVLPRLKLGDFEAALTFVKLALPARGTSNRPFLRTPAACPKSGSWAFSYRPVFDAPHGFELLSDTSRCRVA